MKWHELDERRKRGAIVLLESHGFPSAAAFLAEHADGAVVAVERVKEVLRKYDCEFMPPYATTLVAQDLDIDIDLAEGGDE